MCPQKATSTEVWTQFNNGGDWPTMALSVFVGLIGSVFANNGKRRFFPKIGLQIMIDTAYARYRLRGACKLPALRLTHPSHGVLTDVCRA